MKSMQRRLAALERRMVVEPAILTLSDGRTVAIPGHGDYLLQLFCSAASGNQISHAQSEHLDLIRESTDSREPGGSRFIELIRVFLQGAREIECESGTVDQKR